MSILLETSPETSAGLVGLLVGLCGVGIVLLWRKRMLPAASPIPRAPTPNDAGPAWIGLGAMLLVSVFVPAAMYSLLARPIDVTTQPTTRPIDLQAQILAQAATYLLSLAAVIGIHRYMRTPARRLFGLTRPTVLQFRLLAGTALFSIPLTYLAATTTQLLWQRFDLSHESAHQMLQWMVALSDRPVIRALAILSATVLAPLVEETFFRGHVQTGLRSLIQNKTVAIVMTSILFAAMHEWWMRPPIFVLSLCLGWLYERTGNLWMPIGLHVAFNAISTAVFLGT